jgi:hypothetical protein
MIVLDTNLEAMEGIINTIRLSTDQANPHSPDSASVSLNPAGLQQQTEDAGPFAFGSPLTFTNPFASSSDIKPTSAFDSSHISPTTIIPQNVNGGSDAIDRSSSSAVAGPSGAVNVRTRAAGPHDDPDVPRADDGTWKPPESWAVIDEHGLQNGKLDMTAPADSDSDDDGARARRGDSLNVVDLRRGSLHPPSIHTAESIKPSRKGKERAAPADSELTVRIYRPNGFYHSAAMGISLTVYDLLPALHRRALANDKQTSRLFLKERGKGEYTYRPTIIH